MSLGARAVASMIRQLLVRIVFLVLFAWTVHYWQAWAFVTVLFVADGATSLYLYRKDPALLERRLGQGVRARTEESAAQQKVQGVVQFLGLVTLVLAATDHRKGWSSLSTPVCVGGLALMAVALYMVFLVFKANSYAAATVQVDESQQVVSTGPYALVRHPMYSSLVLQLVAQPLALGSLWALLPAVLVIGVLGVRALDEEKFLAKNLAGYTEYMSRVRHRLVPLVW
jgi:protein-S-isoprenylcysteine O-methyltransferase Ste14